MAVPPVLVEGLQALDAILHLAVPALVKSWNGDEAAVALVTEGDGSPGGFGLVWFVREKLVDDLLQRGERDRDAARRAKYRLATTALSLPRADGKVSCVVAGWGDMIAIELEAEDLRIGQQITAPGGSA